MRGLNLREAPVGYSRQDVRVWSDQLVAIRFKGCSSPSAGWLEINILLTYHPLRDGAAGREEAMTWQIREVRFMNIPTEIVNNFR